MNSHKEVRKLAQLIVLARHGSPRETSQHTGEREREREKSNFSKVDFQLLKMSQ